MNTTALRRPLAPAAGQGPGATGDTVGGARAVLRAELRGRALPQLTHPELDYNLEFPHYNSMAPLVQSRDQAQRQEAIAKMGQQYGLFYFYRGSDPIDAQMAGVVADFAKINHLSLIPVSVDGQVAPSLPDSRPDNGQIQAMRITHFPALFLVDPRSRNFQPLVYGFMTQDDLAKRFLNVSTGFKPNF